MENKDIQKAETYGNLIRIALLSGYIEKERVEELIKESLDNMIEKNHDPDISQPQ